jgi:YrbI family 3-deoxy-D-manno-octulosonate 8-phosphate phosphatase
MKQIDILALIPARGNSKSIPKKNIREFAGHPLIAYSITAALRSRHITRVVVSTDNDEIAKVAREYGAETPFSRPEEFARDDTTDFPVFKHALEWLSTNEKFRPEIVVQLRPTSPVMPVYLIDDAIEVLLNHPEADSVRGVVPSDQNPYKMWQIDPKGPLQPILKVEGLKESYNAPRQELPNTYWQTGHIDVIRTVTLLEKHSMSGRTIYPILIDPKYAIDIDTRLDWERAERLVREGHLEMIYPGKQPRDLPDSVKMLVLDFDGVMTDDRVWVDQNGNETVAASRSDGMGLELLRKKTDIEVFVLSKESNPVVAARCKKLNIPVFQNVDQKSKSIKELINQNKINPSDVVYVGNDVNDLECFPLVGFSAAPRDAFVSVKRSADIVLEHPGGFGAVREICELLIEKCAKK